MAQENVSFTRYYYKVPIGGGGGGGGGELTCTPKSTGVQLGQHGTGCSSRTLASAGSNCSDTTKNLKWPEKKKPNFYSPPPPPTHTHTCVGAIHKWSVFEKCFLSEVITPITINTKFAPLSPHKNISDLPTPYPLPLCVLYHNIDSSDQWRIQGDSGGSLWTKIISFSWRIFRKTIRFS